MKPRAVKTRGAKAEAASHGSPEAGPPADLVTVLFVGFPDSVHSARWVTMLLGRGLRLVFVPVYAFGFVPAFGATTPVSEAPDLLRLTDRDIGVFDLASVPASEVAAAQALLDYHPWRPEWLSQAEFTHPAHVAEAIRRFQPDVVHAMVVQFGGYLCSATKRLLGDRFPPWLVSNWGSDIFLYRMQPEHRGRITEMLSMLDGYHSECERDVGIARQMGFRRFVFPAIPASGGMDFAAFPPLSAFGPPSSRKTVLIKGYHGWAGRALHILAALHLAADALRGFQVRITLAGPAVREMAAAMAAQDGLDIAVEPYLENHSDALKRLAEARVVVGLGISDGISTTLLEAMAVGTFPMQGDRSCGGEWVMPGETGFLVSPHDPACLAEGLKRALTDDAMVEEAATRNRLAVEQRWNSAINGTVAADCYRALIGQAGRLASVPVQPVNAA